MAVNGNRNGWTEVHHCSPLKAEYYEMVMRIGCWTLLVTRRREISRQPQHSTASPGLCSNYSLLLLLLPLLLLLLLLLLLVVVVVVTVVNVIVEAALMLLITVVVVTHC